MSEEKKTNTVNSVFVENMMTLMTPDGVQKYILGTKKNGTPRAVYDVVRDYTKPKKKKKDKKKKGKNKVPASYSFYLNTSAGKKKKKKKKDKHWHI